MSKESEGFLTSCDKCDAMQVTIESKMFSVIRDFSNFTKIINKEQSSMNNSINSTINTVNMIIDQLEENKASLQRAENVINNLKNEIKQLKNNENNEHTDQIQNRSISLTSQDYSSNQNSAELTSNDIDSIKEVINILKMSSNENKNIQHDINCLKYEVKKLKSINSVEIISSNATIQKNECNIHFLDNCNNSQSLIDQSKAIKEAKTEEKDMISNDKLDLEQINILKDEVKDIKKNITSPEEIRKIKKQIKELSRTVDSLESKNTNKVKNNNDSEEESINIKETKEVKEYSDDIFNSIQNLDARISTLESETKKITETITKPKVQQIFVDLPNSRACNLLFRTPNQQNANSKE